MIDEGKLKELLTGCFQDVIMSMYTADMGSINVARIIDLINHRINNARLSVDTEALV